MLEVYLIGAKLQVGFITLAPSVRPQVVALQDLLWMPDYWLSAPFIALGTVQLTGLILNLRGVESSWIWRTVGASAGICLWLWLIIKTLLIGAIGAGSLPFWNMSLLGSILLFLLGINRLPRPGAPGML